MSENERLDSRDKAILKYIKKHSGTNENEIVKALLEQKLSSKLTTLKKIKELKQRGEIIDSLKEGQSGFHHYSINEDKSEFNKIYHSLLEIESLIDKIDNNGGNIREASRSVRSINDSKHHLEFMDATWFNINFVQAYKHGLDQMLHTLLEITSSRIHSEKDSQILYNKIVHLLRKLYDQFTTTPLNEILDEIIEDRFEKAISSPLIKKFGIDISLIDDVKRVMEDYKKQFLSKQKTAEQHEK